MSQSSLLGGVAAEEFLSDADDDLLGPSDSTDSGSDVAGIAPFTADADRSLPVDRPWMPSSAIDSDRSGTGERASADGIDPVAGADILPDRVVGPEEAGVTTHDDEAEEAGHADGIRDARHFAREAERQQDA